MKGTRTNERLLVGCVVPASAVRRDGRRALTVDRAPGMKADTVDNKEAEVLHFR